ncbi:MAG: glycosyltransferase, partial [Pseudomonadota bacterium]
VAAGSNARTPWIAGGRLFGLDGAAQAGARRRRLSLRRALLTFTGLSRLIRKAGVELPTTDPNDPPTRVDAVSGAFFLMSRASFDQLGGFDEGYFLHVEDLDICRRAQAAGGDVVHVPAAGALHYGSTSAAPSTLVEQHKARGLIRYFRKFAGSAPERVLIEIMAPVFFALLTGRAWLRRLIGKTPSPRKT